jgi:amino acid transporter
MLGEPLQTHLGHNERIPKWKALSTLSSDALSSVAYATDAILPVLAAFSAGAMIWSIPIALAITALLAILTLSYRQTIDAYPNGGGAYTVAKENLGTTAGLVAAAALSIDYILTVSVSIASGVENIGSAYPILMAHKVLIGIVVILIIMMMNLRGIRESSTVFAFPTYFFIFSIFLMVGVGLFKAVFGMAPIAVPVTQLINPSVYPVVAPLLLMRAFAAGCSALTGVEAISNGVSVFTYPAQKNAKTTLVWMSLLLACLFLGITSLAHIYGAVPTDDQTLISILAKAVFGNSIFYYMTQIGTALILFLAANTSYADFPRLASLLAKDRYLPRQLASVGDRLVFSNGIMGLSLAAIMIIVVFEGASLSILPLYAIGVFISFTLSQSGMIIHHLRIREPRWVLSLIFNAIGAVATLLVLLDIGWTKFSFGWNFFKGAGVIPVVIVAMLFIFTRIHRHYLAVGRELSQMVDTAPIKFDRVKHTVIIPVSGVHRGITDAVRYALSISDDVRACYVDIEPETTDRVKLQWEKWYPRVPFVVLKSPFRSVIGPLLQYIEDVEKICHDDLITIVVPEFVTSRRWHQLLHNQTALFIRAALLFKRNKVVTSVRYHLGDNV